MSDAQAQVMENVANQTTSEAELKKIEEAKAAAVKQAAAERTAAIIQANPNLSAKEVVFHFKKEKIRNEKGEVVGEGTKRPSINMSLLVPSLISIINSGSESAIRLLEDAVLDTVYTRARELFTEDTERKLDAANFPYEKLDWQAIADLPPAEKRGGGIAKETWESFYDDYVEVMCAVTGKEKARVTKAADIFKQRLQPVRSRKDVLGAMSEFLDVWFTNSKNQEDFVDVYKFLKSKADAFLKEDDSALLEAL